MTFIHADFHQNRTYEISGLLFTGCKIQIFAICNPLSQLGHTIGRAIFTLIQERFGLGNQDLNPRFRFDLTRRVTLEWDNRSEAVADKVTSLTDSTSYRRGAFNIWAYQVWRASNYTRPVGTIGTSVIDAVANIDRDVKFDVNGIAIIDDAHL